MPFSGPELHLRHMLESIVFIEGFVIEMDLAAYQTDHKTRFAVERQMQVLSEAAYRLGDQGQLLAPEVDWRSIRGMGNHLRHGYDRIEDQVIWNTIQLDLPPLKAAIEAALLRVNQVRSVEP